MGFPYCDVTFMVIWSDPIPPSKTSVWGMLASSISTRSQPKILTLNDPSRKEKYTRMIVNVWQIVFGNISIDWKMSEKLWKWFINILSTYRWKGECSRYVAIWIGSFDNINKIDVIIADISKLTEFCCLVEIKQRTNNSECNQDLHLASVFWYSVEAVAYLYRNFGSLAMKNDDVSQQFQIKCRWCVRQCTRNVKTDVVFTSFLKMRESVVNCSFWVNTIGEY